MTLTLIGLGLGNEKDITVRGLEAIRSADKVYLESYTSLLQCSIADLEKHYGKKIITTQREDIENCAEKIVEEAQTKNIALLIIGDPFSATTHINYLIECKKKNIPIKIIHNASILTAVGEIGLELYKYGKVTSIPFADSETPYNVIAENKKAHLHTLALLDLDPKSNKFLTIKEVIERLLQIENKKKSNVITEKTQMVGAARLGSESAIIKAAAAKELTKVDFGKPPYCIIIPAEKLHFIEEEALEIYKTKTT